MIIFWRQGGKFSGGGNDIFFQFLEIRQGGAHYKSSLMIYPSPFSHISCICIYLFSYNISFLLSGTFHND